MDNKGPLPPGYEAKWDHGQKAYFFINHRDKTTSWVDPRTLVTQAQAAPRTPQKAFAPRNRNVVDISTLIQMFPDCPDEILQSVYRSCENNTQAAVNQLKLLGFKDINDHSGSSSHSTAVKGTTSQPKQHRTPTRKPTQSYQYTADHGTGTGASTSYSERTSNSDSRAAQPSSHKEYSSSHLVTDRSTNQRITDTSTSQRITDTSTSQRVTDTSTSQGITDIRTIPGITDISTNQGITDTSTNQGITDTSTNQGITNRSSPQRIINTSTNQGITDTSTNQGITNRSSPQRMINTSTNQGITDTSTNQGITNRSSPQRIINTSSNQRITGTSNGERRTDHNNRRSPTKTVYTSSVKDTTPSPTNKQSVAVGRNKSLQSGPDPSLRLSEHVPAHGHDPSLTQGPDSSRRAGSIGWVGADPSLCSTKRLIVTNI